ncbi:hypothetical protein A2933_01100 [Candidatus Nomurabacteria bacterium RIFCSPLOWO2_01_FULL_46_18]|uniref:Uncharacterized protein n=1 Tax=Candidatus Nomurabacteria bacterium RIFCSPLOWO2_01_FULL_46_18 TaxID=1801783 RepID=A0A1F6XEC4_9BACT|nr:MAG: hypothetical protein A2933_01100 [Candidatus Nomurabacteria bacterium RIFCSPLOWO2_01_FULL_46_18]
MKNMYLVLAALLLGSIPVEAQKTPVCQLGTPFAINPMRPLAPGESIVKAEGGPAVISQREKLGSTHIVYRRCIIPAGTEIVCGLNGCWIKECGNGVWQTEGWSLPLPVARVEKGDRGDVGPMGPMGPQGIQGPPGPTGRDPIPLNIEWEKRDGGISSGTLLGVLGIVVAGFTTWRVIDALDNGDDDSGRPPQVTSDSVTQRCQSTGDTGCPSGISASLARWDGLKTKIPLLNEGSRISVSIPEVRVGARIYFRLP